MAGKRPDQHNIDPREAGATDYKTLPQKGHGGSSLDDTIEMDRQRLAQSEHDVEAQGSTPFYDRGKPAPSKYANAGTPVEERSEPEAEDGREREARGTEDPRDRGVGG
jgi:hypothetical protein